MRFIGRPRGSERARDISGRLLALIEYPHDRRVRLRGGRRLTTLDSPIPPAVPSLPDATKKGQGLLRGQPPA